MVDLIPTVGLGKKESGHRKTVRLIRNSELDQRVCYEAEQQVVKEARQLRVTCVSVVSHAAYTTANWLNSCRHRSRDCSHVLPRPAHVIANQCQLLQLPQSIDR